ncbi:MAG: outer membrane protein assembly factor BamA [Porticoccaceae bacterium]|jgi:outer membrane protein insertion porin family|nr:outer membrane protein assembly factor BamA [Porticoccaceae bacterium]MEA3300408.1 outer membrane protein assembly factor BamA [Pseudomonadota bacterium]HLS97857.1 outer membrane protein assembly factor BamA [Porticoccaceae bacterium]
MKRLLLPLVLCLAASLASAEVFQVEDIRLEGLQRVSAGTVFASMPVNVGDLVDDNSLKQITRTLFRSGYFDDIKVARDGSVLIIAVTERPAVAEISFEGNKAIKTEDLMKALRDNGLAEGQIFRQTILEGMIQELQRQYVAQGRYGAVVKTEVEELPRNRVAIKVNVSEGDVAKIKHINIIGARAFDQEELLDLFESGTTGWFSWLRGNDKYAREKLSGDLERLQSWYLDRGYLKFAIDSTQVSISPDKQAVFVSINVVEGDVYTVSDVALAGDLVVPESEVRRLILLKEGDTFSQQLMTSTNERISRRFGDEGYTFAEVEGFPEVNDADKTAKITFFVNPGKRAYVRRIEFRGNTKTTDEVLRREMRQMEGGSASTALIDQSKVRLERLGFFKSVEVETREVPGTGDQVDVFYTVEEQPSGSIGASVGFAQGTGLVLGANLQENNFLGTGNKVGIGLNRSTYQTNLQFSYSDPYYTSDGVSAGFNVFYRSTDYGEFNLANYTTDSFGSGVNFGYPLSEISSLGFGFNYENLSIDLGSFTSREIENFVLDNGDNYNIFTLNTNWVRSTLNRGVFATRGTNQRISLDIAVPGSDVEYYRLSYSGQYYRPLTDSLTLKLRTDLGYGDAFGTTTRLPFFKNYYGGGFGSIRGFKRNTLGPRDTPANFCPGQNESVPDGALCNDGSTPVPIDDSDPFGGNVLVEMGAEIIFPLPFLKDQRSVQAAFFFDAGNVFDTDCGVTQTNCFKPDGGELRYAAGIGGTWLSGFGPITVSLGKALNASDDDDEEFFQFSLGQTF